MISRLYTLFFLAFFTGFILLSCSGKDKTMLTPQESLKEKKLLDSFSESINYFPEEYAEVETDTTLSNGFRVVIKIQTKMDSNVLVETKKDTITNKTFYRNFVGHVSIFKYGSLIISKEIDKSFIKNELNSKEINLSQYIISNIWISDHFDNSKEKICLNIEYCQPKTTDSCFRFGFFIDESGKYILKEFEI